MAIRLTGGVDPMALAAWCLLAAFEGGEEVECEIYVNPHGWYFRAPGVEDFVIEPDSQALSGDLS